MNARHPPDVLHQLLDGGVLNDAAPPLVHLGGRHVGGGGARGGGRADGVEKTKKKGQVRSIVAVGWRVLSIRQPTHARRGRGGVGGLDGLGQRDEGLLAWGLVDVQVVPHERGDADTRL